MPELSWLEDPGSGDYYGYDLDSLKRDEAYMRFQESEDNTEYFVFKRHYECVECPFTNMYITPPEEAILEKVPQYQYRIYQENATIMPESSSPLCDINDIMSQQSIDLGEFGIYKLNVNRAGCSVDLVKEPVSTVFPLVTVFLIYLGIFAAYYGLLYAWRKFRAQKEDTPKPENTKTRVKSIDTFRGISIVIMIFVNYGAGGYDFFDHAVWNGLHVADLVFPWFMWIMGACIPISLTSSFKRNTSNKDIFTSVLIRSIKLFCLGLFLGGGITLKCLRVFGVLQRFGICYLVVTTICLFCMNRSNDEPQNKVQKIFKDIFTIFKGWIVVLLILTIHELITFLVADSDCPRGYLGPGGMHKDGKYMKCTGGAAGLIDREILGDHRYKHPTSSEVFAEDYPPYLNIPFDPEGILGCLTSVLQVFLGVQAGIILLTYKTHSGRLIRWLSWAIITGLIGGGLCGFSKEDGIIPVNKNLWSLSFVMVTSCFAFTLLSICYILIDVKSWWSGKPFYFAGMNAILLYIGHSMTYGNFPVRWLVDCDEEHRTHFIMTFENIWGTSFWIIVSYYLYSIKYFFTI